MKTLSEHNKEMRERDEFIRRTAHLAGVACDDCGTEMMLRTPGVVNASNPPTQWVDCPHCGKSGLKTR